MYTSSFPSITPMYYSQLLEQMAVKNNLVVTSMRMSKDYKKRFKKKK